MPAEADIHIAQCAICKEWYHKSCEHIPDAVFRDPNCGWKCCIGVKGCTESPGIHIQVQFMVGALHVGIEY